MPLKARKVENSGSYQEGDVGEVSEWQQRMAELLTVDFEGCCPVESDLAGVYRLLLTLLPRSEIDWSSLAATLVRQSSLGCVLKQCSDDDEDEEQDEEEVYGVNSVLRLEPSVGAPAVQQLRSLLLQRCCSSHASTRAQLLFEKTLKSASNLIGLLINERVSNLPTQVALPLFSALRQEMRQVARRDSRFSFTHLLVISRLHVSSVSECQQEEWVHPEEQVLQRHSLCLFKFSMQAECGLAVSGEWDDDDLSLQPVRCVMLLTADKFNAALDEMRCELEQAAQSGK